MGMPEQRDPDRNALLALDAALALPSFFINYTKATLKTYLPSLEFWSYDEGEVMIQEGDEGKEFFILLLGVASVQKQVAEGLPKEVAVLFPRDSFGEISTLAGTKRSATIIAKAASLVARISREDLQKVIERHPQLGESLEAQARERSPRPERPG